jgi:hypothetical protein
VSGGAGSDERWEVIEREARELVDTAASAGLTLRLLGSTGVRMHCPACEQSMLRLRRAAKDIDLACPKRNRTAVRALIEERGYDVDRDVLIAMEGARLSFGHPQTGVELDLFVDRLHFCHTIELDGRYAAHPLTLSAADLLLAKLQVHELTRNDAADAAVVLGAHSLGDLEPDYVTGLLAGDWGFHHSAVANLEAICAQAGSGDRLGLAQDESERVVQRGRALLEQIEAAPKSLGWRMRAKVGERKQWWEDVNEREDTY